MSTIPKQYQGFLTPPENAQGGLSPLQLAATYYMIEGQQVPFFINHQWLKALNVFCNSGILDPKQVNGQGPVVVKGTINADVYTIENKPDCGPDEKNRTEEIYRGKIDSFNIPIWRSGPGEVIRGGSAANGTGGPWATGGIVGPSPDPLNSLDQPAPLVSNLSAAYGLPPGANAWVLESINNPVGFNANVFGNNTPVYIQGLT
jgi:hypothetical protein